jgi:NUDIX domain
LIREIKEELGITYINNISEIKETIQWAKKTGFIITEYVFLIEIDRNINIILSDEHEDYKWCEFNEAYQLLEKENNKNTLKLINSELNKE